MMRGGNIERSRTLLICAAFIIASSSTLPFTGGNVLGGLFGTRKSQYKPLLFFNAPRIDDQECDEMERIVSEIESELHVQVERFDILRDPMSSLLNDQINPSLNRSVPFLYHRESRQRISGLADKDRVRAWAKGRWLSHVPDAMEGEKGGGGGVGPGGKLMMEAGQDDGLDQEELLEDGLSPVQRRGREAMRKRMEEGR